MELNMKQRFSKQWGTSKQPRKQRKYAANAPLHIKRKMMSVNVTKKLREKLKKRNVIVRKGDTVKIMRGKFKKKKGKVLSVFTKQGKVTVEGIQVKKMDGSNALVKLQPSNLQIIEMVDRERKQKTKTEEKAKEDTQRAQEPDKSGKKAETKKEESKPKEKVKSKVEEEKK